MLISLTSCDVHPVGQHSHRVLQFPAHWIIAMAPEEGRGQGWGVVSRTTQGPGVSHTEPKVPDGPCLEAGVWRALTFGDAVLSRQEALLEEALQHGAHGRPVDQLQHEEVGLRGRVMLGPVPRPPWPTHL